MVTSLNSCLRKRKGRTIMVGCVIVFAVGWLFVISGSSQQRLRYSDNTADDYEAFYDSLLSARRDVDDARFQRQDAAVDVVFVQEMKGVRVADDGTKHDSDEQEYNEHSDHDGADSAYDNGYYSDETTNPTRLRHKESNETDSATKENINEKHKESVNTERSKPDAKTKDAQNSNKIHKNRSVLNIDSGHAEEDVHSKSSRRRSAVQNDDAHADQQRRQLNEIRLKKEPCTGNEICMETHGNSVTKGENAKSNAVPVKAQRVETQIPPVEKSGSGHTGQRPATQIPMPDLPEAQGNILSHRDHVPVIVDRIFWSPQLEEGIAKANTDADFEQFRRSIARGRVDVFEKSTWNRCGRPKNHFVTLHDGTSMCARYRHPHNKFIRGDVLSYYLSRVLGLENVPMVTLAEVSSGSPLWQGKDLKKASWTENTITSLSQWIPGLGKDNFGSHVTMPDLLLEAYETGVPLSYKHPLLAELGTNALQMLLQWSDMIVYDYITGNYDRVASMQDGAREQSNPKVIRERIRNLRRDSRTNRLWLIDNESGLVDAYDELYHSFGEAKGRFLNFHRRTLQSVCVFRRGMLAAIAMLASTRSPADKLEALTMASEPVYDQLPRDPLQMRFFREKFGTRLSEVLDWAHGCSRLR